MRPRISLRGCVRPSVRWSARDAFVKIAENGVMQDEDASYVVYTALFFWIIATLSNSGQLLDASIGQRLALSSL